MVICFSPPIEIAKSEFGASQLQAVPFEPKIFQLCRSEAPYFFRFQELQAANNTKIVSLAWRITTPRGFYTPAPTTKRLSWRVFDKKCIDSFLAQEGNVNAIVVNQDDGCVFTCSTAGSVKIWRRIYIETSHILTMTLKFQDSPVNALALSSLTTNCFLYSANSDGSINFWEKEKVSGRHNHGGFLQGHRFGVLSSVAVEKLIFSGSEDTTIRVWRREEGSSFHECLAVLEGHRGPVRSLAACLEMEKVKGFLVYRASLDQSFKVWKVKVMEEEEKMCSDYSERNIEMSTPVLSPSWVDRKIKSNIIFDK